MDTVRRIQKSWNIRKGLLKGVIEQGEILIEALKLVPESGESITFERWKAIVAKELNEARGLYGNGEPLLSEQELTTLALIMYPVRGW